MSSQTEFNAKKTCIHFPILSLVDLNYWSQAGLWIYILILYYIIPYIFKIYWNPFFNLNLTSSVLLRKLLPTCNNNWSTPMANVARLLAAA